MPTVKDLIKQIEEKRNSKLIIYFTGDRNNANASIAEDAVRPLYEHLLKIGFQDKIDLFLYSRGGDVSVPWRIVTMFREFCKEEFSVLIPYKAHSAATLLSLGADSIIMGKKAELSPIDPSLMKIGTGETSGPPVEISVEDVNSYLSFIKDRANISDQSALANVIGLLANYLTPLTLGKINRQNSHIRLAARKLLTCRKEKLEEAKLNSIIETLTEKIYSHGHAIGRKEAQEIGLKIDSPSDEVENLIWALYLEFEKVLKLNEPIDIALILQNKEEELLSDVPIAVIESENLLHKVIVNISMKKKRQVPPNPQININLNLSLPPTVQPQQLPQQIQQVLQQMASQLANQVQNLVQQELIRQSPEVGFDIRGFGGGWKEY
jgi:hypothetical protein